jgi:hypothetical protein
MSKKLEQARAATKTVAGEQSSRLLLSEIEYLHPSELRANKHNAVLFGIEDDNRTKKLRADIAARGILVPLIAKRDGTLMAGHRRFAIAEELGLREIPVQWVLSTLTEEEEIRFLIKDNAYRRQLSAEEWIQLYQRMYPEEFATMMQSERRGGIHKLEESIPEGKANGVRFAQKAHKDSNSSSSPLTPKVIAEATGQHLRVVQKQLKQYKEKRGSADVGTAKSTKQQTFQKLLRAEKADMEMLTALRTNIKEVLRSNKMTRKKAIDVLKSSLKSLESSL